MHRPTLGQLLKRFVRNLGRPATWCRLLIIEAGVAVGWWEFGPVGGLAGLVIAGLLLGDSLVEEPPASKSHECGEDGRHH